MTQPSRPIPEESWTTCTEPSGATTSTDETRSSELVDKVKDRLVPKLSELPGFNGYFLIEAGNGIMSSVSFFDTAAHAEESTQRRVRLGARVGAREHASAPAEDHDRRGRRPRDARARPGLTALGPFDACEEGPRFAGPLTANDDQELRRLAGRMLTARQVADLACLPAACSTPAASVKTSCDRRPTRCDTAALGRREGPRAPSLCAAPAPWIRTRRPLDLRLGRPWFFLRLGCIVERSPRADSPGQCSATCPLDVQRFDVLRRLCWDWC